MKKIKYGVILFACLMVITFMNSIPVQAAPSVSVSGGKTIKEGEKVTITVTGSLENLGGLSGNLSFDTGILKFISSNSEATNIQGGVITFVSTNSANGRISVSFTFQAIKTGKSSISAGCKLANDTDEFQASGGTTVTVAAPGNTTPGTNPPASNKSTDARLSSLIVSPGALTPAFDPGVYNYKLQVDVGTTEVAVSAKPAHAKAVVTSVNGATGLVKGPNTVTVVVKAENGNTATYTIQVQVGLYPEQVVIEAKVGDLKLKVKNDLTGVALPTGAVVTPIEIAGETVQGISYNNGMLTLVMLVDDKGAGALYIYNSDGPTYTLFQEVNVPALQYVITAFDKDYKVPDGYKKVLITIGSYTNVEALVLDSSSTKKNTKARKSEEATADRFFLFQGKNMAGEVNWYQYDAKEGTVQVCAKPTAVSIQDQDSNSTNEKENSSIISPTLIIIVLGILCVGLAIPLVVLVVKQPKYREE